ncbi:MAG: PAS domain S-box protein [Burkholderiales bacterium]
MTVLDKARHTPQARHPVCARREAAPALFRLLADSALSRAALSACGLPLAMVDADSPGRPVTYVNAAFEGLFGYREAEVRGRAVVDLLFRGDEALAQRLFGERASRWRLPAWSKDGTALQVEAALGAVRAADGRLTHWVLGIVDRSELESLRAEIAALRAQPAAVAN